MACTGRAGRGGEPAIRGDEIGLIAIIEHGNLSRLTNRSDVGCDCYADFTRDGTLDLLDFLVYANEFNAGEDGTDCDGDGELTLFDFLCFVNAFNEGGWGGMKRDSTAEGRARKPGGVRQVA